MSDYSQEEVRLLDEFALAAIPHFVRAEACYAFLDGMLTERRKRVPQTPPLGTVITTNPPKSVPAPVAQPEPENGELTEEAVEEWEGEARFSYQVNADRYILINRQITFAVALMREGLAAKTALEGYKRAGNSASSPEDSQQLARDLDLAERLVTAERERDTYKRLLDEGAKAVGHAAEKERDEAKAEVEKLRTWFEALTRSSFPAPEQKSGPAKLMGYTLPDVCRILGDFDAATHHLRQRADEGAAERERWKGAHTRAVAEANNLRARAEKAEKERDAFADTAEHWRRQTEKAEKAAAAFRVELERLSSFDYVRDTKLIRDILALHPAAKATGVS